MHHVLHERIPCPSFKTLSTWWKHKSMTVKNRVIRHYIIRVVGTLKLLNHLDIIGEIKLLNFFSIFSFYILLIFFLDFISVLNPLFYGKISSYRSHMRTCPSLWNTVLRNFLTRFTISRRINDAQIGETYELHSDLTIYTTKS